MAIAISCRMNALHHQHQPNLDDATPGHLRAAALARQDHQAQTVESCPKQASPRLHSRIHDGARQGLPDATARSDCSRPRSLIILDLLEPFLGLSPGLRPSWHQSRCNLLGLSSLNCGACKASESLVAAISWIFSSLYPDEKESAVVDVDHPPDMFEERGSLLTLLKPT